MLFDSENVYLYTNSVCYTFKIWVLPYFKKKLCMLEGIMRRDRTTTRDRMDKDHTSRF